MKKIFFLVPVVLTVFIGISTNASTVRSMSAKQAFAHQHVCPLTGKPNAIGCHGYVIDHIIPLCAGGADAPANMQWQTLADSYKKDAIERATCRKQRK